MIVLKDISKSFSKDKSTFKALKCINLSIEKGDIFGIIGYSGAGKSTLVRCINLLEKPDCGNVYIDNVDITKLDRKELNSYRKNIGMIFQQFNLLEQRTALENICYPLEIQKIKKSKAIQKAMSLLEIVGLSDKAISYPSELSGGQKQRVAIARALATDPSVLLCDEATSALDPKTTNSILDLLKDINKKLNVTIVIITHEMKVVEKICDKVAVMDNGEIVESGNVKEVFIKPQSSVTRQLINTGSEHTKMLHRKNIIRIVFDGNSATQPVITDLITKCNVSINILCARTETINDALIGEMILQLPQDEDSKARVKQYLDSINTHYEEE